MTKILTTYLLSEKGKSFYISNNLIKISKPNCNTLGFKKDLFQKIVKKNIIKKNLLNNSFILKSTEPKQNSALMLHFKKLYKARFKKRIPKAFYKNFKKTFGVKNYNKTKFKISNKIENLFKFYLTIVVKKNNVFCTFSDLKQNKTLKSCSSGTYKIKISKKTLRYTYDLVLEKFYRDIKKEVYKKKRLTNKKGLFITLVCSKRLRKKVSKSIRRNFKKIPLLIKALNKKIFNGCRPPKKVRKKRRRMRIYK